MQAAARLRHSALAGRPSGLLPPWRRVRAAWPCMRARDRHRGATYSPHTLGAASSNALLLSGFEMCANLYYVGAMPMARCNGAR